MHPQRSKRPQDSESCTVRIYHTVGLTDLLLATAPDRRPFTSESHILFPVMDCNVATPSFLCPFCVTVHRSTLSFSRHQNTTSEIL